MMGKVQDAFLGSLTFGDIDPESGDATIFHAAIRDEIP